MTVLMERPVEEPVLKTGRHWEWIGLGALLIGTAVAYIWGLERVSLL